ncbi:hypothetical protein GA0070561_5606 [Micromonospora saelicesensis]|uniref:Uncharacterized protein n=1 Tax=Micromonospora saelicesensis TaxID=285676 RepID=A0A1C4ZNP2_9ACTN|nr:hypothetical protein GA0070561_5606 [Micromonospora saelicesensis]
MEPASLALWAVARLCLPTALGITATVGAAGAWMSEGSRAAGQPGSARARYRVGLPEHLERFYCWP